MKSDVITLLRDYTHDVAIRNQVIMQNMVAAKSELDWRETHWQEPNAFSRERVQ